MNNKNHNLKKIEKKNYYIYNIIIIIMSQKLYFGTTNEEYRNDSNTSNKNLNKNPDNYIKNNQTSRLADGFIPSQRKVFYGSVYEDFMKK